jgi:hypothetical protein
MRLQLDRRAVVLLVNRFADVQRLALQLEMILDQHAIEQDRDIGRLSLRYAIQKHQLAAALDIPALHLGSHVVRRTPGKGKDRESRILLRSRGESSTIYNEDILNIVHLAKAVQR